jgi:hypothetical protein
MNRNTGPADPNRPRIEEDLSEFGELVFVGVPALLDPILLPPPPPLDTPVLKITITTDAPRDYRIPLPVTAPADFSFLTMSIDGHGWSPEQSLVIADACWLIENVFGRSDDVNEKNLVNALQRTPILPGALDKVLPYVGSNHLAANAFNVRDGVILVDVRDVDEFGVFNLVDSLLHEAHHACLDLLVPDTAIEIIQMEICAWGRTATRMEQIFSMIEELPGFGEDVRNVWRAQLSCVIATDCLGLATYRLFEAAHALSVALSETRATHNRYDPVDGEVSYEYFVRTLPQLEAFIGQAAQASSSPRGYDHLVVANEILTDAENARASRHPKLLNAFVKFGAAIAEVESQRANLARATEVEYTAVKTFLDRRPAEG